MKSLLNNINTLTNSVKENTEWFFGDMADQGISGSDITACLKAICDDVCGDANLENFDAVELNMVRTAIHNALCEMEAA